MERALSAPVVHADESGWPLLGKKTKPRGSVWTLTTPEVVVYRMMPSKSEEDGHRVLGNYKGTVIADGYVVYDNLSRAGPFRLVNCWAHVKRKADDIAENFPLACDELLKMIRELYDVERLVPGTVSGRCGRPEAAASSAPATFPTPDGADRKMAVCSAWPASK